VTQTEGWGAGVIDRLASDVKAFPGLRGFSASISRMRAFYLAYVPESENPAQPVPNSRARKSARVVLDRSNDLKDTALDK